MKYVITAILGMAATTTTYLSTYLTSPIWQAVMMGLSFFLWLAFVVALVRAFKPPP
ncbi:MAG TPA: hypothetical protein VG733_02500 [Chthoniobacteraceae bacterium]|nr:hypothetical protein [Chthoniobacteraceae bacterium]